MNLTFDTRCALAALTRTLGAVDRRTVSPVLAHVLITPGALDTVTLRTSNMDMEAAASFTAQGNGEPITVPATTLAEVLRNLPDGSEAKLSWSPGDARVKLQCGRSRFQLAHLPAADFPPARDADWAFDAPVDPRRLHAALKAVAWAQIKDATRQFLMGVNITVVGNQMRLRASDGKAVTEYVMFAAEGDVAVTIPTRTVSEMLSFLDGARGETTLALSPGRVRLRDDDGEISSAVVGIPFADIDKVFVREAPHSVTVGREALAAAARRTIAGTGGGDVGLKLTISAGAMTLSARGDAGDGEDQLEAQGGEHEAVIGITPSLLLDALANQLSNTVTFGYVDGVKPFSLTGEDAAHAITLGTRRV